MSTGHWLEIAEWVRTGRTWQGLLPLSAFERFGATVHGDGAVEVAVRFERDGLTRARVTGRCHVVAEVVCARCACEADVPIECDFDFRLVESEAEARKLTPGFDTVVANGERVSIAALLEDDLLLSLPDAGCADRDTCPNWAEQQEAVAASAPERRASPFAVLGALATPEAKRKS